MLGSLDDQIKYVKEMVPLLRHGIRGGGGGGSLKIYKIVTVCPKLAELVANEFVPSEIKPLWDEILALLPKSAFSINQSHNVEATDFVEAYKIAMDLLKNLQVICKDAAIKSISEECELEEYYR